MAVRPVCGEAVAIPEGVNAAPSDGLGSEIDPGIVGPSACGPKEFPPSMPVFAPNVPSPGGVVPNVGAPSGDEPRVDPKDMRPREDVPRGAVPSSVPDEVSANDGAGANRGAGASVNVVVAPALESAVDDELVPGLMPALVLGLVLGLAPRLVLGPVIVLRLAPERLLAF